MVTLKQIGLIVLGLLVVGMVLCWVPKIEVFGWNQVWHLQKISPAFYKRDVFAQEDRARQTLATIVGGLAVLAGAALTLRSVRAAEKSAEIARDNAETARRVAEQNAETTLKSIKIAQDKQIADRFTAAVNNLSTEGSDKMTVRLGGIYALEQIALDSPEYHWTVMEVLTAYIRDKRPKDKTSVKPPAKIKMRAKPQEVAEVKTEEEKREETRKARYLPTDINEILRVILRRNVSQDQGRKLDIYNVDLYGAYLVGSNEAGAELEGAVMGATSLADADLRGANLADAHLERADLAFANLEGADLRKANLRDAIVWGTKLAGAKLEGAKLGGTKLADCGGLAQPQLDLADKTESPNSWPPGLTFNGQSAPDLSAPPPPTV